MATAVCKACSKIKHWYAQRGTRLADQRCDCGGALGAARWIPAGGGEPGKYVLASKVPASRKPAKWPISKPGDIWAYDSSGNKRACFEARVGDVVEYKPNGSRCMLMCEILEFKAYKVRVRQLTTMREILIAPSVLRIIRDGSWLG